MDPIKARNIIVRDELDNIIYGDPISNDVPEGTIQITKNKNELYECSAPGCSVKMKYQKPFCSRCEKIFMPRARKVK